MQVLRLGATHLVKSNPKVICLIYWQFTRPPVLRHGERFDIPQIYVPFPARHQPHWGGGHMVPLLDERDLGFFWRIKSTAGFGDSRASGPKAGILIRLWNRRAVDVNWLHFLVLVWQMWRSPLIVIHLHLPLHMLMSAVHPHYPTYPKAWVVHPSCVYDPVVTWAFTRHCCPVRGRLTKQVPLNDCLGTRGKKWPYQRVSGHFYVW